MRGCGTAASAKQRHGCLSRADDELYEALHRDIERVLEALGERPAIVCVKANTARYSHGSTRLCIHRPGYCMVLQTP